MFFNNKRINEGSILNHFCSRLLGKNVLEIVNCVPKLKLIDMSIIKSEIWSKYSVEAVSLLLDIVVDSKMSEMIMTRRKKNNKKYIIFYAKNFIWCNRCILFWCISEFNNFFLLIDLFLIFFFWPRSVKHLLEVKGVEKKIWQQK